MPPLGGRTPRGDQPFAGTPFKAVNIPRANDDIVFLACTSQEAAWWCICSYSVVGGNVGFSVTNVSVNSDEDISNLMMCGTGRRIE
jgi:hypothetical protein